MTDAEYRVLRRIADATEHLLEKQTGVAVRRGEHLPDCPGCASIYIRGTTRGREAEKP